VNRENRGKCDAASSDRGQRQPMPRTRLKTVHACHPSRRIVSRTFMHCSSAKITLIYVKFLKTATKVSAEAMSTNTDNVEGE
jgi:hypothetical protein